MGISASQARLLTITARLTSNEYESQQISNAKMRLAVQSQQASDEYISALNTRQLQFMTYDAQGAPITEDLTANALYQYSDMKNQYALLNHNGQMLVTNYDAKNFEASATLDEFLAKNGVEKIYKTETLKNNAEQLKSGGELDGYYKVWLDAIEKVETPTSDSDYQQAKAVALEVYEDKSALYNSGVSINIEDYQKNLADAKAKFSNCATYDRWIQAKAEEAYPEAYKNSLKYYAVLNEFLAESQDLGATSVDELWEYSDATKAQWYTNLWYKMNGPSTDKSVQGTNATNYSKLDINLASSKDWIQDALEQGILSIEVASYEESNNLIEDENRPLSLTLKGITWSSTEYGSCIDFTEVDDESAIARAEAEYQKKNNEISAKDKRYENKIKTLDTEHNALQTQYESVKSAMTKNIDRSYKTFSG